MENRARRNVVEVNKTLSSSSVLGAFIFCLDWGICFGLTFWGMSGLQAGARQNAQRRFFRYWWLELTGIRRSYHCKQWVPEQSLRAFHRTQLGGLVAQGGWRFASFVHMFVVFVFLFWLSWLYVVCLCLCGCPLVSWGRFGNHLSVETVWERKLRFRTSCASLKKNGLWGSEGSNT